MFFLKFLHVCHISMFQIIKIFLIEDKENLSKQTKTTQEHKKIPKQNMSPKKQKQKKLRGPARRPTAKGSEQRRRLKRLQRHRCQPCGRQRRQLRRLQRHRYCILDLLWLFLVNINFNLDQKHITFSNMQKNKKLHTHAIFFMANALYPHKVNFQSSIPQ